MRVALYWTPDVGDALSQAGNTWLGRDPEVGTALPQPDLHGIAAYTAAPRGYGFHATLRPPMRLATGWEEFVAAAHEIAAATASFDLPALAVADMDGFLALRAQAPCPALHALADRCVTETDRHRLRAGAAELAQRRAGGLSAEQDALLMRWGYPHVLSAWRFHMTLSARLGAAEMARLLPAAEAHFAQALAQSRRVGAIAVFTQHGDEAFLIAERIRFSGSF